MHDIPQSQLERKTTMKISEKTTQELKEMALVEVAYGLLLEKKETKEFKVLLAEIASLLELTEEQVDSCMAQFYTDLNIDGRFTSMNHQWGLKSWYPVDQIEEEVVIAPKRKRGKKAAAEDLTEDFDEVEEEFEDFEESDIEEEEELPEDEENQDGEEEEEFDEDEAEEPVEVSLSEVEDEEEMEAEREERELD